mmetsp:Transcript_29038/g.51990  ORF Transcript_29038/g.51990 Transcript_29038/m.51990 type:complete len:441 (+) Transcript_29038:624-1946(+)
MLPMSLPSARPCRPLEIDRSTLRDRLFSRRLAADPEFSLPDRLGSKPFLMEADISMPREATDLILLSPSNMASEEGRWPKAMFLKLELPSPPLLVTCPTTEDGARLDEPRAEPLLGPPRMVPTSDDLAPRSPRSPRSLFFFFGRQSSDGKSTPAHKPFKRLRSSKPKFGVPTCGFCFAWLGKGETWSSRWLDRAMESRAGPASTETSALSLAFSFSRRVRKTGPGAAKAEEETAGVGMARFAASSLLHSTAACAAAAAAFSFSFCFFSRSCRSFSAASFSSGVFRFRGLRFTIMMVLMVPSRLSVSMPLSVQLLRKSDLSAAWAVRRIRGSRCSSPWTKPRAATRLSSSAWETVFVQRVCSSSLTRDGTTGERCASAAPPLTAEGCLLRCRWFSSSSSLFSCCARRVSRTGSVSTSKMACFISALDMLDWPQGNCPSSTT